MLTLAACGGAATTDPFHVISDPSEDVSGHEPNPNSPPEEDAQHYVSLSLDESSNDYDVVLSDLTETNAAFAGAVVVRHSGELIGQAALPENFPVTASYTGSNVQAVIADGTTRLYNFDQGRAQITIGPNNILILDQFSGNLIAENTQSGVAVENPDITLKWTGFSVCDGDHFCNGNLAINGDDITNKVLSDAATTSAKATFFGEHAQAIGGMIYIDDPSRLNVMADFIADRR